MKIISVFNNKGGVGKTTLVYHLANSLAEMGNKVLMIDLDPQCNLTFHALEEKEILRIWSEEDEFIDDFRLSKEKYSKKEFEEINRSYRTIHYLLKPTEEGAGDLDTLSKPITLQEGLDIIPGRITMHKFEDIIAERWSGLYRGDSLSIKTVTEIRSLAKKYADEFNYNYVIIDTSPSLGILNKVIISTVDGFIVPCTPDMFSLYGIRNIGESLTKWKKEFDTIFSLLSTHKQKAFNGRFVQFLGYTIYNAKKYTGKSTNRYNLAQAHYKYVEDIPEYIKQYIKQEVRTHLTDDLLKVPIGEAAIIHTHNTYPSVAQQYKCPMWQVPDVADESTIKASQDRYRELKEKYTQFCNELLNRIETLN